MNDSGVLIEQKSDEKANEFRELGNVNYKKNEYLNALILYNKAITFACTKKVRSFGYANRSAVYITLGYYNECLENIKWACENEYPADKCKNLKNRELKCKELMLKGRKNVAEDPWNFFKMSYPVNEKIPWIVDRLDLRTTKKYGRGVYATKDLKAGDVISIEEPLITFLYHYGYYKHCANCFKTNMLNLIPCIQSASMMFCSTDCMDNFYSKNIEMDLSRHDDIRMLSIVSYPFGGYEELDDFVYKADLKDLTKTIFDFDLSNSEDPEYEKNLAMCFLSLSSKKQHVVNDDSCSIFKYVSNKTANHLLSLFPLNAVEDFSSSGRTEININDNRKISLFRSLINHSCLPNVFFVTIQNKIVGFVVKPIKAGEQLFRCYFDKNFIFYFKNKMQMFNIHSFKCSCDECMFNSYQSKLFKVPALIMNRNNFVKAKELLKEGWRKLNAKQVDVYDIEKETFLILSTLGYYATFPY
ncbi:hypothetical protein ACKWTF_009293 [Chironomus riparius]